MTISNMDIIKNIRMIEWIKSELLSNVSGIYTMLANGDKEVKNDDVSSFCSNMIILSYLLGKRLGINFTDIDDRIESKLKAAISEKSNVEKNFGDFSNLLEYKLIERSNSKVKEV